MRGIRKNNQKEKQTPHLKIGKKGQSKKNKKIHRAKRKKEESQ